MALVFPVLVPMIAAIAMVLFRLDEQKANTAAVISALIHVFSGVWLMVTILDVQAMALWVGNWPAPAGICLVADYLSAVMVLITSVIHTAVIVYARKDIDRSQIRAGFYPFMQLLTAAVCGAFLTGDLFNLYVWFEVMLMASFGIMVMGRSEGRMTGAVKYVTMNLLSTLFLITAIGLIYGLTGTLNMADLSEKMALVENRALVNSVALLLITAFGIKSALFPMFFWLPASYPILPVPVSAFFAGMLTKVGVYALIRMFTLVFVNDTVITHTTLMVLAVLTMVSGVVAAASQTKIRCILSFHIISQVGYMVLGLSLFTPLALAGTLVYLVHHIIVKTNLFLISGLIRNAAGSFDLNHIGSLYKTRSLLSIGFFIPAFSLAGFPPLSGFWAKLLIIYACLESRHYILGAVAAVVGLMTLFSMIKIWSEAFWKPLPGNQTDPVAVKPLSAWMMAPVISLALITILTGLFIEPVYRFAMVAGEQLMNPMLYILAVKGGG
jgi:multicomponent Na+:H+ antiporter subunit D